MAGILSGAMEGGGRALQNVGEQGMRHVSASILQEQAAEIQRMREERLAEIRKGEIQFAEELRRAPAKAAAEEIDQKLAKPAYDEGSDSVRPHSPAEQAEVREGAYRRQGLVGEAQQERQTEMQRQRDLDARSDREADNRRADRQLDENARHNQAVEMLQRGQLDEAKATGQLDRAIKQIAVDNAKRVDELRKEFAGATPERKREIQEEIQLLTGKDNDNYLPVPIKDETGAITGYHVLDRRRGVWLDGPKGGAQGAPGKGERPPLDGFFRDRPRPQAGATGGGAADSPEGGSQSGGGAAPRDPSVRVQGMGLVPKSVIPQRIKEFQAAFQEAQAKGDSDAMVRHGKVIQDLKAALESPGI